MNALILHGTANNSSGNWFPWLKDELEKLDYSVWLPDLPDADLPSIEKYNNFLLGRDWNFNNSLIVGHSSGAVEILGLLSALPLGQKINTAILIGSFSQDLPGTNKRQGLFKEPFNFELIKSRAKQFIFIHSDNDPYCPPDQARYLHSQLGGEFILIPGQGHFNLEASPSYNQFPKLLQIIKEKVPA